MSPRIQSIVTQFVEDLTKAIQAEGAAAFAAAIGGSEAGNGIRAPHAASPGKGRRGTAKPKAAARPKGAKRDPQEIEALTKAFIAQVRKTPGQNIETLAKSLGTATKELQLPVLKAWELKTIKSTGQRRGTKYFPK